MKPLQINLKEARKRKGWSQEATSRKIGINRARYAKYEEGCSPNYETLKVILEAFEIREEDMYPFVYNEKFWEK